MAALRVLSNLQLEIIEKDWYKRRAPTAHAKAIAVELIDFKPVANHLCDMKVTFDDGSEKILRSRVIFNNLRQQWTVDGAEVAVRVLTLSDSN